MCKLPVITAPFMSKKPNEEPNAGNEKKAQQSVDRNNEKTQQEEEKRVSGSSNAARNVIPQPKQLQRQQLPESQQGGSASAAPETLANKAASQPPMHRLSPGTSQPSTSNTQLGAGINQQQLPSSPSNARIDGTQHPQTSLSNTRPDGSTSARIGAANQQILPPLRPATPKTAMERTRNQVNEVTGVMRGNLDALIERGDKLTTLDARADNLALNSERFNHTTKQLKQKCWWKSMQYTLCITLLILFVTTIIVLLVCHYTGLF
ncbi:hypothetical protein BV898_11861 [Hypsibius exemplaris]|uniref:V-SNARE coiled-coil homology domain-containing protein n=1 Tax=Hypsibius exemplaris TaxID=2072580 RepID=A0A1W0WFI8_HYPEX|nr:hypothetical protein BV898_11861 [Hypsibius exemplaris]